MDNPEINELIDTAPFIDSNLKEDCKEYFKQIRTGLDDWLYSYSLPTMIRQGDILDSFEAIYYIVSEDTLEVSEIQDCPFIILSHTCDINSDGRNRTPFISVAPIFSYREFAESPHPGYSTQAWDSFLNAIKANRITDILYIPAKNPLDESIVLLDRICSVDSKLLKLRTEKQSSNRILSLSQIGFYFFLIKLNYHFARYEDREEVQRE